MKRHLLRQQLIKAWEKTIRGPYADMRINSEHGLQVHFCLALFQIFQCDETKREIFVEPTLLLGPPETQKRRIPDLVICNSRQVIGIIELKYAPRSLPTYDKDLETLSLIKASSETLKISNERFRGPAQARPFSVAENLVLCWAAVHEEKPFPVDFEQKAQDMGSHYLELRAITSPFDVRIEVKGGKAITRSAST
jgi:hypothetical protein